MSRRQACALQLRDDRHGHGRAGDDVHRPHGLLRHLNALRRDILSRCGYVIASTTMRNSEYLAGKFAGNVVFLSVFTAGSC
jgi:hypothetical protein